jgi:hypothetical protein
MRKSFVCVLLLLALAVGASAAELPAPGPEPRVVAAAEYHGNRKSRIFHRPGCRYYNCKNCVVLFTSRQAALEAGFRPCKVCKP